MLEQQRAAKLNDTELPKEKKPDKFAPTSFEDDPGSSNSGFYELKVCAFSYGYFALIVRLVFKAVITHKGRSSNSGHYVAWVRIQDDKWAMCDGERERKKNEQYKQRTFCRRRCVFDGRAANSQAVWRR